LRHRVRIEPIWEAGDSPAQDDLSGWRPAGHARAARGAAQGPRDPTRAAVLDSNRTI